MSRLQEFIDHLVRLEQFVEQSENMSIQCSFALYDKMILRANRLKLAGGRLRLCPSIIEESEGSDE